MKIALLTQGFFPFSIGGIQKHSYYLAKYWAGQHHDVTVYTSGAGDTNGLAEYFSTSELERITFENVAFPRAAPFPGHYIYESYKFSEALCQKVQQHEGFDVVYAQGFTSWYFLRRRVYSDKLIVNLHGLEMFQVSVNWKNKLQNALLKIPAKSIVKKAVRQISLGGKLTEILYREGAPKKAVVEVPNGVESSWIVDADKIRNAIKPIRFIFVGRYERRKGIEEFHEVIKQTIDTLAYEVCFVGPIPEDRKFDHPAVQYAGVTKDAGKIKSLLLASDVLVCPSYSEGMPTVILEAMSCGCAIIATDVGAVSCMLDASNGWLIEGDIRSGLKRFMAEAVTSDLTQKKKSSIEKVRRDFTWDSVIAKTNEALQHVMAQQKS